MSDPAPATPPSSRITLLRYRASSDERTRYAANASLACTLSKFDVTLRDGQAQFRPLENFGTEQEARAALDPQLRSWEVWARLRADQYTIRFQFEESDSEAWPPPPRGTFVSTPGTGKMQLRGSDVPLCVERTVYEPPPACFVVDDLVEVGLMLLDDANEQPRHLLKFGMAFLSCAENEYGGRANLAKVLVFDLDVVRDLGKLCAEGGTGVEARKHKASRRIDLNEARRAWAKLVVREILIRHGQRAAGGSPTPMFLTRMP